MGSRMSGLRPLATLVGAWLAAASFMTRPASAATPCADPVAEAVSVQGTVEVQRSGRSSWEALAYKDAVCPGDAVRARERSRADFVMVNETILRIDQSTRVVFSAPVKEPFTLVTVISGAAYFISRTPRRFRVETPFVNAGVEGTEFLVRVEGGEAVLTVFEGRVAAENSGIAPSMSGGDAATQIGTVRPRSGSSQVDRSGRKRPRGSLASMTNGSFARVMAQNSASALPNSKS